MPGRFILEQGVVLVNLCLLGLASNAT
jgi:hypothetical protein